MLSSDDLQIFIDLYTCYEIAREDTNSSWISTTELINPFIPLGLSSRSVDNLGKIFREVEKSNVYYFARVISNFDEETIRAAVDAIKADPIVNVPRISECIKHGIERDQRLNILSLSYERRYAHILTLLQGESGKS